MTLEVFLPNRFGLPPCRRCQQPATLPHTATQTRPLGLHGEDSGFLRGFGAKGLKLQPQMAQKVRQIIEV